MPYQLIDLESYDVLGHYPTHAEARSRAARERLRSYEIRCDERRFEYWEPREGDDDRARQSLGLPSRAEYA